MGGLQVQGLTSFYKVPPALSPDEPQLRPGQWCFVAVLRDCSACSGLWASSTLGTGDTGSSAACPSPRCVPESPLLSSAGGAPSPLDTSHQGQCRDPRITTAHLPVPSTAPGHTLSPDPGPRLTLTLVPDQPLCQL